MLTTNNPPSSGGTPSPDSVGSSQIIDGSITTADIGDKQVTLAKFQDIATARLLGRNSAGAGIVEALDGPTVITLLNLSASFQAVDAELSAIAGLTSAADRVPYFTGLGTAALATFTTFGRSLVDDADAAAARTTLGVAIGTDVQAANANLTALAGLTGAADKLPYFTGVGAMANADLSSFARTLLDDANAATARATLGLAIGTDVQAQDAELSALAGLTSAADKLPYFTGAGTAGTTDFTAFARTFMDDANAAAVRSTLGLVIGTDVQAYDAELAAIAGLTSAADKLPYFTGSGSAALADLTTFGRSLIDDAAASNARTTLGLVIGTDVQAYDAELAALAGLTSAADKLPYFTGSGAAALADLTSAARSVLDDTSIANMLITLGLGVFHPGYKAGKYYGGPYGNVTSVTIATKGRIWAVPFVCYKTQTFDGIGMFCNTAGSGATAKMGVWDATGTAGRPGSLVTNGSINTSQNCNTSSADVFATFAANITLNPGVYWLGAKFDWTTTAPGMISHNSVVPANMLVGGSSVNGGIGNGQSGSNQFVYVDDTYSNNMPSSFGTATEVAGAVGALLALRAV